MISYALRRLFHDKRLSAATLLGLATAIAIASAVPIYADASSLRALQERLSVNKGGFATARPPFAFMFSYVGSVDGYLDVERLDGANAFLTGAAPATLQLPIVANVRYVKTPQFTLFPAGEDRYESARRPLAWTYLAYVTDLEPHVVLVEGAWPNEASQDADEVEVLISEAMAAETGLGPGESLIAYRAAEASAGAGERVQVPVRVAGVWAAEDADDPYWFLEPEGLSDLLIMPEASFRQIVAPAMRDEVNLAIWYWVASHDWVRSDDVLPTLQRLTRVTSQAGAFLPGISLVLSPADALRDYRASAYRLTLVLTVFAVPILALVCNFVAMISAMAVRSRQREIAVLRSRGAGVRQVVLVHGLEGVLLLVVALPVGLAAGLLLARVIGDTTSFLKLGAPRNLDVALTSSAWWIAFGAAALGLVACVVPAWRAAGHTVISYRSQRARDLGALGFWQVDVVLLLGASYAYYVLEQRADALDPSVVVEPLRDPLLFAAPALALLALALVSARLFPVLARIVEAVYCVLSRGVVGAIGLAELARQPRAHIGSLLMVILTTSFATYFASVALTLDRGVWDRSLYRTGGGFRLVETGVAASSEKMAAAGDLSGVSDALSLAEGHWLLVPAEQHLGIAGISAATRVGTYPVAVRAGGRNARATLYGIDRLTFPKAAFFRDDFAVASLGALMNALASTQNGILVGERYARVNQSSVGDTVRVSFGAFGERTEMMFTIVGTLLHFPTYYQENDEAGFLLVADLDSIFQQIGFEIPYDVWVQTVPGVTKDALEDGLQQHGIPVMGIEDGGELAHTEQRCPEWGGFVGILSAGFASAAGLTMLAFVLDALVSLRLRFVEFGVLRAIGLSMGQMARVVLVRQMLVALYGTSLGTAIGIGVSYLYVPHLAIGGSFGGTVPPILVRIAWGDISAVYLALLVALGAITLFTVLSLRRARFFEAIKLGQTT